MVLLLDDVDKRDALGLLEEWRFDARPFFMRSNAYETLVRELRAYVRGEISGRSFLIAAHRGVGKTSLVLRVVEDLDREARRSAMETTGGLPRRPLLVKLHGSTLLTPPAPDNGITPRPTAAHTPSAETALQQITIALYRSLAGEIADAFARHARDAASRPGGPMDLLELAAQLTLDLDLAPDLAALRGYWQRLDRLDTGVLWPGTVGRRMAMEGMADRGMREIVALATANQAFQVCAGRVETSQRAKGSAERMAQMENAGRIDAKDAANKLFGLIAGGLVGGALLKSAPAGVAATAGLGVAAVRHASVRLVE